MATIFTRIIDGEIPSRMLWEDDVCVGFLDVRPLAPGHVLVVPREETDHWTDLPAPTASHLMVVAHAIGRAQRVVFSPKRIGLMIAGFEVAHTHLHVVPMESMRNLDFDHVDSTPDQDALDRYLGELRQALADANHDAVSSR